MTQTGRTMSCVEVGPNLHTRMVLHLSPYAVSPPTYGGPLRTHNLCLQLARDYQVELFCQQVRREDLSWNLQPLMRRLAPNYTEFCSRNLLSVISYAVCSRLGCPAIPQSSILQMSSPRWLRERLAASSVINVEHPWQFRWVYDRVRGRKPIVLTAHNVEAELSDSRALRAPRWLAALLRKEALQRERFAMRHATRIFTMSAENSATIVATYDVPPERCVVVPNGVDCSRFQPAQAGLRAARKRQIGLDDKFVVLFAGSTHGPNREAVEHIVRWAHAWPDQRVCFLVVGSVGAAFANVKHPNLFFSGRVDDVMPYFEAADVAVNPLVAGSGTTLKQVEFMAMGLPTIATPSGARGIPLQDGVHGFIRELDAVPAQLHWLLQHPAERERVGVDARQFALQHFDWPVIARQVVEVYRELECSFAHRDAARSSE